MGVYSTFSSYVERAAFVNATIRNINTDSIDVTIDGVDYDALDWRYNCQGGYVPTDPGIPYSSGQTVIVEWDTFNEEPKAVIGFPDGARSCVGLGLLIHTSMPPPNLRAYKLEAWVNDDSIKVSTCESTGDPIDPPRSYRIILNDITAAYTALDPDYPSVHGKIIDCRFAENYPYRIGLLVDREISPYATEDEVAIVKYLVLTYSINPSTMEMSLENYWGLETGPLGCSGGGCGEDALLRNNPWCPDWSCQCDPPGARNGCFSCATQYYWSYTIPANIFNADGEVVPREYTAIDDYRSESSGSCGDSCCGDCYQTYLPSRIWLDKNSDPVIFATGNRTAHVMVMPGGNKTISSTWNHPVSLVYLKTGENQRSGVYRQQESIWEYQVTQVDRCFKAKERYSVSVTGHYYPTGGWEYDHHHTYDWDDSQYGIGNCYNMVAQQIMSNLVRGDPSVFKCNYAHNLLGDYYDQLPVIDLTVMSQITEAVAGERACLAPMGVVCGCSPIWSVFYSIYLILSSDSYFYIRNHTWRRGDCSDESEGGSDDWKTHSFSMTFPINDGISPREALFIARPDAALTWGRATLLGPLFKSYTTAFIGGGTVQEIRCKEGQTNPNCYDPITEDHINNPDLTYDVSELGEERSWQMLVAPSRGGWIFRLIRDGTFDYSYAFYGFADLQEDGGGEITHSGNSGFVKHYTSTYFDPKGHDVVVYDPSV